MYIYATEARIWGVYNEVNRTRVISASLADYIYPCYKLGRNIQNLAAEDQRFDTKRSTTKYLPAIYGSDKNVLREPNASKMRVVDRWRWNGLAGS